MPGDDAERQPDREQADEGRVLGDVEEDPDLEEMLDRDRADQQDRRQDAPDQMVQHEDRDGAAPVGAARGLDRRGQALDPYGTGSTGSVGIFMLPQNLDCRHWP